jgi:histidinol dehydrogenase
MEKSTRITSLTKGGSDGWEVFYRARQMIKSGTPVVELTIGEHDIRTHGDKALVGYTNQFDRMSASNMGELTIKVSTLKEAYDTLNDKQKTALKKAADRINSYHQKQKQATWTYIEDDGTMLGQKITPLDRVGLYVPGGKAAYPSSVLMNAIPAKVAGVEELIMVVPTPDSVVNQLVLAAA